MNTESPQSLNVLSLNTQLSNKSQPYNYYHHQLNYVFKCEKICPQNQVGSDSLVMLCDA